MTIGMTGRITVVDYGIGNLHSIARAAEKAGGNVELASSPGSIAGADRLLLPGVGAFGACAEQLRNAALVEPILEFARTGRPFLGICVGMQLLFDYSLEFGRHAGLGLLPGKVVPIPPDENGEACRKIPHIGWTTLELPPGRTTWQDTLLQSADAGRTSAYFVHSFNCAPENPADRLANAFHQGFSVCAAVERDNITGFQCHPEKSGEAGLRIFRHFLDR